MVNFTIAEKQYKIADRFTVSQWKEMMKWDFEHKAHWPRIMQVATGAPLEYLEEVDGGKP